MKIPAPEAGLVIRYSYLWKREFDGGQEEGNKARPCAIVLTIIGPSRGKEIVVLPVTHSPPTPSQDAVEIPLVTKKRLGLDSERSWIVTTEANIFRWPGPDLRPSKNGDFSTVVYGPLPPDLFLRIRRKYLEHNQRRRAKIVRRTE